MLKQEVYCKPENISLLPHIIHHVHNLIENDAKTIKERHKQKLAKWSQRQDSPICKIENTIKFIGDVKNYLIL